MEERNRCVWEYEHKSCQFFLLPIKRVPSSSSSSCSCSSSPSSVILYRIFPPHKNIPSWFLFILPQHTPTPQPSLLSQNQNTTIPRVSLPLQTPFTSKLHFRTHSIKAKRDKTSLPHKKGGKEKNPDTPTYTNTSIFPSWLHDLFSPPFRSPRGASRETSFTIEPPTLLREAGDSRTRTQSVATIGETHATL